MSKVNVNSIEPETGTTLTLGASGDTVDVPSGATLDVTGATVTGLSAGKVLQVLSLSYNTTETWTTSWVDTGLTIDITPTATANKVLVMITAYFGGNSDVYFRIVRDSTDISQAAAAGDRRVTTGANIIGDENAVMPMSAIFLDSPSATSATTYKVMVSAETAGSLNRSNGDGDYSDRPRSNSTITVMEIEG